jgi:hypothetical protein
MEVSAISSPNRRSFRCFKHLGLFGAPLMDKNTKTALIGGGLLVLCWLIPAILEAVGKI